MDILLIYYENFIHDGDQIVLEFSNNQLAQRNLWGVAVDELLATDYLLDDDTLWALANHQNSITNILQNNNGQVINIAEIDYDAFGNIVEGHNPLHYGYTGKYHDAITNLQWNINRWYDSTTGQWISEDPIGFEGGDANLYRYVGNAVLDMLDPNGICFVAGTPVLLADGTTKNIEDFVGDEDVWARPHDNPTAQAQKCRVVRAFKNEPKETILITFDNGLKIQATAEHPFFVPTKGWVACKDLQIGDECVNLNGDYLKVISKELSGQKVPVYNLNVEGNHTYFVGTDKLKSVLVHNVCVDGVEYADDSWQGYVTNVGLTVRGMLYTGPTKLAGAVAETASHPVLSAKNAYWGAGELVYGISSSAYSTSQDFVNAPGQTTINIRNILSAVINVSF
jgi:RHS repeat-associated protein